MDRPEAISKIWSAVLKREDTVDDLVAESVSRGLLTKDECEAIIGSAVKFAERITPKE